MTGLSLFPLSSQLVLQALSNTNSNMFSYNTFWGLFRIELQSANVEF